MSVIDKWLKLHREGGGAATFATSATNPNTARDTNGLDVASDLLQAATFPSESENVAKCSNRVATKNDVKNQALTGNVADVANVAREGDFGAHVANVAAATVGSPHRRAERLAADPNRCGGCGELVLDDDRFYEYEGGYRCHTDPECLIAWNEKWHAAEGREYDAEFYRQNLIPGDVIDSGPEHSACAGAPLAQCTEGIACLDPDHAPADVPLRRWREFLTAARRLFDDGIVAQAAAAGWTAHDLFGCDDTKPFGRADQMGLVWFVKGGHIVSISMSAAIIEAATGARQTYRRRDGVPGRVLAWELSRPKKSADRQC